MVSPSQVIKIGIRIVPQSRECSICLLCRKFRKLSNGRTISHMV
jgi:hypothetical protein